jgi:hypothetical protein
MGIESKYKIAKIKTNNIGYSMRVNYDTVGDVFWAIVGNYDPETPWTFDHETPKRKTLVKCLDDIINKNYTLIEHY